MQRILLFLATNLAVVVVLGVVANLLGVNRFLPTNGLDLGALLAFAAIMGFGGAFTSLLMSRPIAKWSTGAQVGIAGRPGWMALFASHPPIEARIAAPQGR